MNTNIDNFEERAARLLLKHHGFVFRQARRFMILPDLAEDVAQQVFVDFLKSADHWKQDKDVRPLLMVMTRRTAQKIWKERAKFLPEPLRAIAELVRQEQTETMTKHDLSDERIGALRHCLQSLSSKGRKLISLHYFDGISTEMLSRQLKKKKNAVAQSLFRLREKLRTCIEFTLKKEGENDGHAR